MVSGGGTGAAWMAGSSAASPASQRSESGGHQRTEPGSQDIHLLENPLLIPKDKDVVVYCTCPGDKTSRRVLHSAEAMNFFRVKFLKGGLAGWKAEGYPVEPYEKPFHLDTNM